MAHSHNEGFTPDESKVIHAFEREITNAISGAGKVRLYCWPAYNDKIEARHRLVGLRVAEVSIEYGSGGESFMQVDVPQGALMCFLAERALIARMEEWDEADEREEAWRFMKAFLGSEAFTRWERSNPAPKVEEE